MTVNDHLSNLTMGTRSARHECMHTLTLLLLFSLSIIPNASSSSQNYNAYNYDMTTPQFTPDGRLLQVEYASLASTHSSPCVIWKLRIDTSDDVTLVMTAKSSRKIQNRLIRLSDTTAVCLSGVVSDSMALLSKVYELQDDNRRLYGSPLTDLQIANSIAMSCQRHSFGGGLRPYGSSIVVLSSSSSHQHQRILQTDPSGAAVTVSHDASTTPASSPPLLHIVGGSGRSVEELRRTLERAAPPETLNQALIVMAKRLVETALGENHPPEDAWLEVMVMSKERGIHKLTDSQVERLLAQVREQ